MLSVGPKTLVLLTSGPGSLMPPYLLEGHLGGRVTVHHRNC